MPVLYEKHDQVGIVTLSRPEARNAWGQDFTDGIAEYLAAMEDDDEIRCAVLTGDDRGGAFSAGANLKNPQTHTLTSTAEFIKSLPKRKDRQFEVLSNFPKPLIAAVNGYAIGVGCIVTFCCDLVLASERAEWRLPQVPLGILPAYGGAVRLARWVGKGHTMRLAMGFPHWSRPVVGPTRRVASQNHGGGRVYCLPTAAGCADGKGVAKSRFGHSQSLGCLTRRPLSIHGP